MDLIGFNSLAGLPQLLYHRWDPDLPKERKTSPEVGYRLDSELTEKRVVRLWQHSFLLLNSFSLNILPPKVFRHYFPNDWESLTKVLHACCVFISMWNCKMLSNFVKRAGLKILKFKIFSHWGNIARKPWGIKCFDSPCMWLSYAEYGS